MFLTTNVYSPKDSNKIAYILIFNNMLFGMAMDIHLPSMPIMVKDLKTTEFMVQLVLILFAFGAIFSRLVWGPISDLYGRKNIMLITIGIQSLGQLGCTFAPTIEILIGFRAFQSLGAGITSVLGTAIIADLYSNKTERARMLGLLEMAFPIAFILAPIIGAYLVEITGGWRMNFLLIFVFSMSAWYLVFKFIPETHEPKRGERIINQFKIYSKFLTHVKFLSYSSMVGLMIAAHMMFVINAPFIYMNDFGLSVTEYAKYQFVPMMFNMLAVLVFRIVVNIFGISKCARFGIYALTCLIPIYLIIGVVNINWSANTILVLICIQSSLVAFIIPGFTAKALDKFPDIKGASSAAIGSIRTLFMSFGMLIASYLIGSEYDKIFVAMGAIIAIVAVMYWMFHIKELQYSKKQFEKDPEPKDVNDNLAQL